MHATLAPDDATFLNNCFDKLLHLLPVLWGKAWWPSLLTLLRALQVLCLQPFSSVHVGPVHRAAWDTLPPTSAFQSPDTSLRPCLQAFYPRWLSLVPYTVLQGAQPIPLPG